MHEEEDVVVNAHVTNVLSFRGYDKSSRLWVPHTHIYIYLYTVILINDELCVVYYCGFQVSS